MNLEFKIAVKLPEDTVFAPGTDVNFLAGELSAFMAALMTFYAASELGVPQITISVPEVPEPLIVTKVIIV